MVRAWAEPGKLTVVGPWHKCVRWSGSPPASSDELGFLEWIAEADNGARVEDSADSYLIRDGHIHAMSIHYTVLPPGR